MKKFDWEKHASVVVDEVADAEADNANRLVIRMIAQAGAARPEQGLNKDEIKRFIEWVADKTSERILSNALLTGSIRKEELNQHVTDVITDVTKLEADSGVRVIIRMIAQAGATNPERGLDEDEVRRLVTRIATETARKILAPEIVATQFS